MVAFRIDHSSAKKVKYIHSPSASSAQEKVVAVRYLPCPALANRAFTCHSRVSVTFLRANGERIQAKGKVGETLLDVVVNNNIDLDGFGACEGTLTCSTCHLIFKPADYDKLPEKPSDEEMDMLDLAYELQDTSRLGCQITLSKELNGLEVQLPSTINDARA